MFCRMCGFPNKNALSPTARIPLKTQAMPLPDRGKPLTARSFLSFCANSSICAHIFIQDRRGIRTVGDMAFLLGNPHILKASKRLIFVFIAAPQDKEKKLFRNRT